jgi:NitT/TauT family transport system ATP-binding protein
MKVMALPSDIDSIPNAKVGQIIELIEKIEILGGSSDKSGLSFALHVKDGTVSTPILAASRLGLVVVEGENVALTETGRTFLDSDPVHRTQVFGEQLLRMEPFQTIARAAARGPLTDDDIVNLVKARFRSARKWKESTVNEMLRTIKNWCVYGEILTYDTESKRFVGK